MPVYRCANGRYKVGRSGKCSYRTKAAAERAYRAYLARRHGNPGHGWDKLYDAGSAPMKDEK